MEPNDPEYIEFLAEKYDENKFLEDITKETQICKKVT